LRPRRSNDTKMSNTNFPPHLSVDPQPVASLQVDPQPVASLQVDPQSVASLTGEALLKAPLLSFRKIIADFPLYVQNELKCARRTLQNKLAQERRRAKCKFMGIQNRRSLPKASVAPEILDGEDKASVAPEILDGEDKASVVLEVLHGEHEASVVSEVLHGEHEASVVSEVLHGEHEASDVPKVLHGEHEASDVPKVLYGEHEASVVPEVLHEEHEASVVPKVLHGEHEASVVPDDPNNKCVDPKDLPPCPPECQGTCRLCNAYYRDQLQKARKYNVNYRKNLTGCGKKPPRGGVRLESPFNNCFLLRKSRSQRNDAKRRRNDAKRRPNVANVLTSGTSQEEFP
jgi:hypothetical protein